jgi:hypothetical protein
MVARDQNGSVILHVPSGTYLRLDAAATEILDLVREEGEDSATLSIARRHELDSDVAIADVKSVITAISTAGSGTASTGRRPTLQGSISVVRGWSRLSTPAKLAVAQATAMTVAVELSLHLFPIDKIARWVGAPLADSQGQADTELPELTRDQLSDKERRFLAAMDWTLARWIFDGTCLRRALVSGWALRSRKPALHLGLLDDDEALAHAWLSFETFTLGSVGDVRDFTRLI